MNKFTRSIINLIEELESKENQNITLASKILFEAMKNDKVVHIFATGHSHMFGEEMFYRAGGLVQVNPILEPFLMQHEGAVRSTQFERLPGIAKLIYDSLDLKEGEPFIIVSNSGINSVPVEMAEIVKANNHPLICITSAEVSKELKSRTLNNKKLYELGDVVIDNHAPYGDGVIESKYGKIGSSSTILNSFIAQMLVLNIIDLYEEEGLIPPIYQSANTPGGDEHNKFLYDKYKNRVKSLY